MSNKSVEQTKIYELALSVARYWHGNGKDRCGAPYIEHPLAVSSYCISDDGRIVGLLHDVDFDYQTSGHTKRPQCWDDLRSDDSFRRFYTAIDCLFRRKGECLEEQYERILKNDLAIEVKFACMRHDSEKTRYSEKFKHEAEETHQKYFRRAKLLFKLVGAERAKKLTSNETYKWVNSDLQEWTT